MAEFLKGQLDYIFFFYGLAFILLAVTSTALREKDQCKLPWPWLGLFGFTDGVNEWLEMVALGYGPNFVFGSIRVALMACSFAFLVEFGRAGMIALKGKGPSRWVFLPLFGLAALGGVGGLTDLNVSCRYMLGLTGGVWAGFVLLQASRIERSNRIYLAVSGWAMLGYGFASGIIGPTSTFFPSWFVNQEFFLNALGIPIQWVRAILAIVIAASIWRFYQEIHCTRFLSTPQKTHYSLQICLAFAAILFTGWAATEKIGRNTRENMEDSLIARSRLVAAAVNDDFLKNLTGSSADLGTPSYERMKKLLYTFTTVRYLRE